MKLEDMEPRIMYAYYWVKIDGIYVVAQCVKYHDHMRNSYYWKTIGTDRDRSCFDLESVGEMITRNQ